MTSLPGPIGRFLGQLGERNIEIAAIAKYSHNARPSQSFLGQRARYSVVEADERVVATGIAVVNDFGSGLGFQFLGVDQGLVGAMI